MSRTDWVAAYLRCDGRAASAEAKLDEYQAAAEGNRWECCRNAYEAVESGDFSRVSFAKAVGKSKDTIADQVTMWAKYGGVASNRRPSYGDAYFEAHGKTREENSTARNRSHAKRVLSDPDEARRLASDPELRLAMTEAIAAAEKVTPTPKRTEPARSDDGAFVDCMQAMLRAEQQLNRLVENLNAGRRNGFLTPSVLREFTAKLRNYADAIDEIAASRGLTDEALAEWIGEG